MLSTIALPFGLRRRKKHRIYLPTETWMLILGWLQRENLFKLNESPWNRQFNSVVEELVHRKGNVKLGKLHIAKIEKSYRKFPRIWHEYSKARAVMFRGEEVSSNWSNYWDDKKKLKTVPFADSLPPENISSFSSLIIEYIDPTVLNFLRQMQRLFTNVHLTIRNGGEADNLAANIGAIDLLLPMFQGLAVVTIGPTYHAMLMDDLPTGTLENMESRAEGARHRQRQGCALFNNPFNELFLKLICTQRADGEPNMLYIDTDRGSVPLLVLQIKNLFLDATIPVCFFVKINWWIDKWATDMEFQNHTTGEQLIISKCCCHRHDWQYAMDHRCVLISRYPIGIEDTEWLKQKQAEMQRKVWPRDWSDRQIKLQYNLKIDLMREDGEAAEREQT